MTKRFLTVPVVAARQLVTDTEALFLPIEGRRIDSVRTRQWPTADEARATRRVGILRANLPANRVLVLTEEDWETARATLPAWRSATTRTVDLWDGATDAFPGRDKDDPAPRGQDVRPPRGPLSPSRR